MGIMGRAVYREKLMAQELQEVRNLEAAGIRKGIRYKIDPGVNGGIIYSYNGVITGFMTVDCFGGDEIESAVITDSEAVWKEMTTLLIAYAKEKQAKQILYIAAPEDQFVTHRLGLQGLKSSFTEYRMEFDAGCFSPLSINGTSIRKAVQTDHDYIIGLDKEAYGDEATYTSTRDLENSYIILKDYQPAGKLRIDEADGIHGIYGIVVEQQQRGKGIGGQALTSILSHFIDRNVRHIYLEVDSENPAAFHLYKKLGFKIASEFRYYPYRL